MPDLGFSGLNKLTTLSLLKWRLSQSPSQIAALYYESGEWHSVNWKSYASIVRTLSYRLQEFGCKYGDRVAIYAETCFQWATLDLAVQTFGGVVVAIHPQYSLSEVLHALNVSHAKLLFYGGEAPARKIRQILSGAAHEFTACSLDGLEVPPGVPRYDSFLCGAQPDYSADEDFRGSDQVNEDSLATLVFTSGTSGRPKTVCLTQKNLVATAVASYRHLNHQTSNPRSFHWLPFAHLFGRIGLYVDIVAACSATYTRGLEYIAEDFRRARPHFTFVVPKALARFQGRILENLQRQVRWKRIIFKGWLSIAARPEGRRGLAASWRKNIFRVLSGFLGTTVFADVREGFGGSLKLIIVGGAAVDPDTCRFLESFGIAVREGYGMTETAGAAFINPYDNFQTGSVGTSIDTVEFKIAEDDELLLKGDSLFVGYLDPADNVNAFTKDGWFRTGDLARTDDNGFVTITGRKKDIIITDAGENISPERIEAKLASFALVKDALVVGDQRPYLVAIISVLSGQNNFDDLSDPVLIGSVQGIVDEVNRGLAKYEKIRSFLLINEEFSVERRELTSTLKKRRKVIEQRYQSSIELLYRRSASFRKGQIVDKVIEDPYDAYRPSTRTPQIS